MEKDTHTHTRPNDEGPTSDAHHRLLGVAKDEATDAETLAGLAGSQSEIIRGAVAENKSTPESVIEALLTDKSSHVRNMLRKRGASVSSIPTICIAGKNNIAVNALSLILSEHPEYDICFIPNPTDNGLDSWQNSLKKAGNDLGVRQVSIKEIYDVEDLLFLSLEYSELIDTTKFKSGKLFNIHFSLLPKYKGMYTSALPIMHGEEYSGVTLHKIDNGIDTGEIIEQIKFGIDPEDTARDLYFKYLENSFLLLKNNLDRLISGNYSCAPQPASNSSYYSKKSIDYKNIKIDFFKTAFEVKNQFRAFTFREYQMPMFEGWQIHRTETTTNRSKGRPGTKALETEELIVVATIDYDIKLFKDYYSVLWESCEIGDFEKFELAVKRIPDINFANPRNWNSIIISTYHGHLKIVQRLIELGADVNSKNRNGTTLLMYGLSYFERTQDSRIFELLVNLGSNSTDKDKNGKTLRDYIIQNKCEQLLKYLN